MRALIPLAFSFLCVAAPAQERLDVLFLGDRGHHKPAERMHQIQVIMAQRGIDLFYTDRVQDLTKAKLAHYDCVVLYANHMVLPKQHEQALLDFVAGGKGFVPIHCASACFGNSPKFVALVGGQFRRHGTGVFSVETSKPNHPVMKGLKSFESWDETYVHARLSEDREVLQFRAEKDGRKEPWTWVRKQGAGRVFYTAWGHDQRTWSKPGFHDLLERGIRWASGDRFVDKRPRAAKFEYQEAEVPHYEPGVSRRDMRNLPKMQKPMTPDASQARLRVPAEFRVERFASEPDIMKPIAMTWDERGRLWIAETRDYPNNLQKEGHGNDRIKICADTDGDGKADTFTVFADKLSIPTSLVHAGGGLIVAQAPHFLFLKDTNGDDKADVREVLFTGWSTGDTHAGPSNLRYGFDNQIWGAVGYSGYRGTIGDEQHAFRQGFYRFRPDGSKLEFLTSTTNNTWGLAFSEDGHVFGSTANGNPSVFMGIPNRYYEKVSGFASRSLQTIAETTQFHPITDKVRQVDWHGKFTAAAGHALYTARQFPQRYWNRAAFVNAPTGHLLNQFFLEKKGTHFVARDGFNLLASDDEWTAPIMAEVGPDGAVWVIDWYNYIVQHNPTPKGFKTGKGNAYVTPLRDKRHGRIYRVSHRDRPLGQVLDLRKAKTNELVAALGSDNLFWRLTAQRLLVERTPPGAVAKLVGLLGDRKVDAVGLDPKVQHALWALHGMDEIEAIPEATRDQLLSHPSAAVRRVAVQVLPRQMAIAHHVKLLADTDLHVRLTALLALSEAPADPDVGRALFGALRDPKNGGDRWLPDALTAAAVQHGGGFLAAALEQFEVKDPKRSGQPVNLLPNPGFEDADGKNPRAWRVRTYGGSAEHHYVSEGRNGGRCVKITSTTGSDTSWFVDVAVEPGANYEFSGWIKTVDLKRKSGGAHGALFNAHELQGRPNVRTPGQRGTQGWKRFSITFNAKGRSRIGINCLFGGWGHATGTAWYDDLALVRVAGSDLPGPMRRTIGRVMTSFIERAPHSVGKLLESIPKASPGFATRLLRGLREGWPDGRLAKLRGPELHALRKFATDAGPTDTVLEMLALIHKIGHTVMEPRTVSVWIQALEKDASLVAAQKIVMLLPHTHEAQRAQVLERLIQRIAPQTATAVAAGILRAVASTGNESVGSMVVNEWSQYTGRVQRVAVDVLMRRGPWALELLQMIEAGAIDAKALTGEQWLRLESHTSADVKAMAKRARKNKPSAMRAAVLEKFAKVPTMRGDAKQGQALFTQHCAQCHKLGAAGGTLGPALDGIGATSAADLLIAILDPNQSVDGTYLMWVVETKQGEFLAGRLDAESRTTIEIRDVDDKRHVIKRADIKTMEQSKLSLMPATFEILGEKGLADLLTFLKTQTKKGHE